MEDIKPPEDIKWKEKVWLKFKHLAQVYGTAIVVGTAGGVGTGKMTQDWWRGKTEYSPTAHAKLQAEVDSLNDFEKFKKEKIEKEKKSILEKMGSVFEEVKKGVINPEEYIKDTKMYKEMRLSLLNIVAATDAVAFWFPASVMFLMLAGYTRRRMKDGLGDPIKKEAERRFAENYDDVRNRVNTLSRILVTGKMPSGEPLTESWQRQAKEELIQITKQGVESFPDDFTDTESQE